MVIARERSWTLIHRRLNGAFKVTGVSDRNVKATSKVHEGSCLK